MDTDSFMHIKIYDFYEDIKTMVDFFDASDY